MADHRPPHVLLASSVGVIGGAERVLLACGRALREHEPTVGRSALLLGEGPLGAALEREGVHVRSVPLPPRLSSAGDSRLRGRSAWTRVGAAFAFATRVPATLAFVRRLRRAVAEVAPTLVHVHGLKALLLVARALPPGTPLVWHVHDFVSERPMAARLLRRTARRVTRAVAVSEAVRHDLARVAPDVPVSVVHNGVDLDRFSPADRDGSALDRLAGLADASRSVVRVGLVAAYADWKGHEVFLRALARTGPQVRAYLVGGPLYATPGSQTSLPRLRDLAASLGLADRVGFVPFQDDPADVYRMLDVVVHASTRPEPFGLTIVEAMACGRAVVVAAAGGALELFEEGETAIGHPPGDAEALAQAIDRLAHDPVARARLGRTARAAVEARFGHARFARELLAVYAEVARTLA